MCINKVATIISIITLWSSKLQAIIDYFDFILIFHQDHFRAFLILLDIVYFLCSYFQHDIQRPHLGQLFFKAYPEDLQLFWLNLFQNIKSDVSQSLSNSTSIVSDDSIENFARYMSIPISELKFKMCASGEFKFDLYDLNNEVQNNIGHDASNKNLHKVYASFFWQDFISILIQTNWLDQAYLTQNWIDLCKSNDNIKYWFNHLAFTWGKSLSRMLLISTQFFSQYKEQFQILFQQSNGLEKENFKKWKIQNDFTPNRNLYIYKYLNKFRLLCNFRVNFYDLYCWWCIM